MNQAEQDFIEEYTRILLVQWCTQCLSTIGHIHNMTDVGGFQAPASTAQLCMDFAVEKGWVGKAEPRKVLAKGYATAASFLRR